MTEFYVSPETISERAELLKSFAQDLLNSGALPADKLVLRENRFQLLAEGYFLLNKSYKTWRIHNGHRTERPKIAALQACVISRLQPFLPKQHPIDQTDVALIKCNEIFAFAYGIGILEQKFEPNTPEKIDLFLRVLDIISASSAETIEAYIIDKKYGTGRTLASYEASIGAINERDKLGINSLICIFEFLSPKAAALLG